MWREGAGGKREGEGGKGGRTEKACHHAHTIMQITNHSIVHTKRIKGTNVQHTVPSVPRICLMLLFHSFFFSNRL